MHLKLIACNALRREVFLCAARSPHTIDVFMLQQGLHDTPNLLREGVQREIDAPMPVHPRANSEMLSCCTEAEKPYDAVLLGYALCSNGTAGLSARVCPVVIPRAHDCITLLLGARDRYREYFDRHPGTFWYSSGWMETCMMPGPEQRRMKHDFYCEKYGEDNARFLMEAESDWYRKYNRAAYIDWQFPNSLREKELVREAAGYLKWEYDEIPGDASLLQRMLDGKWAGDEFLVLQPGQTSEADPAGRDILKVKP